MAISNGYCSLTELKAAVGIPTADTASDTALEALAEAVSRWIEDPERTGRRFYAPSESRVYTPTKSHRVFVDDFVSVTAVKTDEDGDGTYETTWDAADYRLKPSNATLKAIPYDEIVTAPNGTKSFPLVDEGLQVTGKCGYSETTPAKVKQACLLRCAQLWMLRQGPLGQMAGGDWGQVSTAVTPYAVIMDLLEGFRKIEVG